jgi:hypothetical protein
MRNNATNAAAAVGFGWRTVAHVRRSADLAFFAPLFWYQNPVTIFSC